MPNSAAIYQQLKQLAKNLELDGIGFATGLFNRRQLNLYLTQVRQCLTQVGYDKRLNFVGINGQIYALYDPQRISEIEALRWLKSRIQDPIQLTRRTAEPFCCR